MRVYKTEDLMKANKYIHIFQRVVSAAEEDGEETLHTHDFIEIVYILSGRVTHVIDGHQYAVSHGDILFMNYGCTHHFFSDEDYSYVNILFSPELMSENIVTPDNAFSVLALTAFNDMRSDANFGRISFFGTERREIEDIISAMQKEYAGKQTSWKTVLGNYLSTLIVKMLRKTEMGIGAVEILDIWRELSEYIDANLNSKLTLSDLAQKCFYNPSYFSRVFKEKFGMTFLEYITRKRLDHAIDLLSTTELPVEEIGRQVGFSDSKSFYHAFSRYLNGTPAQYRKRRM